LVAAVGELSSPGPQGGAAVKQLADVPASTARAAVSASIASLA
jgi:hypothetical protein